LDLWTFPNNKSFVSATGHYIDSNWILQEIVIDFGSISGRHNGANIADGFFNILEDYGIASKVCYLL
jgi:hypothetical protein